MTDYKTMYECLCLYTRALTEDYNKLNEENTQLRFLLTDNISGGIIEERYNPNQPRDEKGRWSSSGGGMVISIKQTPYDTPLTANREEIESKDYIKKFKGLTNSPVGDKRIMELSKKAIYENDGKDTETVYIANAKNGKQLGEPIKLGAYGGNGIELPTAGCDNNSLILIHNHPNNVAFSFDDFMTLNYTPQIKTMIASGHDGTVYKLSVGKGKRLSILNDTEYNYVFNEWARKYKENLDLCAVEHFSKKLNWEFSYE